MQGSHPNVCDSRLGAALTHQPSTEAVLGTGSPLAKGQPIRFGFSVGRLRLLLMPHTFSEVVTQAVIYPLTIEATLVFDEAGLLMTATIDDLSVSGLTLGD